MESNSFIILNILLGRTIIEFNIVMSVQFCTALKFFYICTKKQQSLRKVWRWSGKCPDFASEA